MCIVLFAYKVHPGFPLVLAANRDEFFARPSRPAHFWKDAPSVFGGRDMKEGGAWLGVSREGRIAVLTNYRDPSAVRPEVPSRGALVRDFLAGGPDAPEYLAALAARASLYNPFHILCGTPWDLHYYSNREGAPRPVTPGIHGFSNGLLDTPWPKVEFGKKELARILGLPDEDWTGELFTLLADQKTAPDAALPDTGVGLEIERMLSAVFVRSPGYGTRASTLMMVTAEGAVYFEERTYGPEEGSAPPRAVTDNMTSFEVEPGEGWRIREQ
jgi:uncharacterized protein with NRDE domain